MAFSTALRSQLLCGLQSESIGHAPQPSMSPMPAVLWIVCTAVILRVLFAKVETLTADLLASSCIHCPTPHLIASWGGSSNFRETVRSEHILLFALTLPQTQSSKALLHYCWVSRHYVQHLLIYLVKNGVNV